MVEHCLRREASIERGNQLPNGIAKGVSEENNKNSKHER